MAEHENALARFARRCLESLERGYARLLELVLGRAWLLLPLVGLVLGSGIALFQRTPSELSPAEDRGYIRASARGPEGATIEWTTRNLAQIEPVVAEVPEVASVFVIAGVPEVTRGIVVIRLKPWEERERSQQEILTALRPQLARSRAWLRHPAARRRWARIHAARPCSSSSRPAAAMPSSPRSRSGSCAPWKTGPA